MAVDVGSCLECFKVVREFETGTLWVFGCLGLKGIRDCCDKLPSVSGITVACVTDTGLESEH